MKNHSHLRRVHWSQFSFVIFSIGLSRNMTLGQLTLFRFYLFVFFWISKFFEQLVSFSCSLISWNSICAIVIFRNTWKIRLVIVCGSMTNTHEYLLTTFLPFFLPPRLWSLLSQSTFRLSNFFLVDWLLTINWILWNEFRETETMIPSNEEEDPSTLKNLIPSESTSNVSEETNPEQGKLLFKCQFPFYVLFGLYKRRKKARRWICLIDCFWSNASLPSKGKLIAVRNRFPQEEVRERVKNYVYDILNFHLTNKSVPEQNVIKVLNVTCSYARVRNLAAYHLEGIC